MPTISIPRDLFYKELGVTMSDQEFDELCFEFGIELDEVTTEKRQVLNMAGGNADVASLSDEVIYKIEIPANRYDLLCLEGLVDALRVYLGKAQMPSVTVTPGPLVMNVDASVNSIRPFIVCAVLRDITFTQASYDSFIELQDKLHTGLARHRTLVSMGTHDLDRLQGPSLSYEARAPETIRFRPLNQAAEVDGPGLIRLYETDLKIRRYLHIIRDSPVFPVLYDGARTVLSLPPLINSDHSKISLATRNVFVEVTATDLHKAHVALNMLVAAFSRYCAVPYSVESVRVRYPDGTEAVTPAWRNRTETVSVAYINRMTGLQLDAPQISKLLSRMLLHAQPNPSNDELVDVHVSPIRSDILHACDIMEDVAIAYGFSRLPKAVPPTNCFGAALPINKLADKVRREVALVGFSEVLTFTLCSYAENFAQLGRKDPGNEAVVLSNPKTSDFEVVHTSLIPQMLKTIHSNKSQPLPIKIFQVLDVVLQSSGNDVGARNERRLCAVYCAMTSGFDIIHGLLDRVMQMLCVPMDATQGYSIRASALPTFFEGRQAEILYKGTVIGTFGVIHPKVSQAFEAPYVSTLLELNLEPFL